MKRWRAPRSWCSASTCTGPYLSPSRPGSGCGCPSTYSPGDGRCQVPALASHHHHVGCQAGSSRRGGGGGRGGGNGGSGG
eukprot:6372407-Prymnesium_polylepis.1